MKDLNPQTLSMIGLSSLAMDIVLKVSIDELRETANEYYLLISEKYAGDEKKIEAYNTRMRAFVQLREVLHHTQQFMGDEDLDIL